MYVYFLGNSSLKNLANCKKYFIRKTLIDLFQYSLCTFFSRYYYIIIAHGTTV